MVTTYPRLPLALTVVAPNVNEKTRLRRAYKALKSGESIYGVTLQYAPPPLCEFAEIPSDFINGVRGYFASSCGMIKTPSGRTTSGCTSGCRVYATVNIGAHEYRVHRLVAATFLPQTEENRM